MNILIIGNGFDIAHQLPTRYRDFLHICRISKKAEITWYNYKPSVSLKHLEETEKVEIENISSAMGYDLWDDFVNLIKDNFWINHFQVRKDVIGENWINFEDEIKNVLESLYKDMSNSKNEVISLDMITDSEIVAFCKANSLQMNNRTYRDLFSKLMGEHKKLIRALEIYMDGYINKKEIIKISYITKKKVDKVLSFNYTDTYIEKYNPLVECCFIHGRADIRKNARNCNLVLGFDDHYIKEARVMPELIPFEKYCQRIVNRTDNLYFEWLEEMQDLEENNIIIYGHSLGPADGDVLREFIMHDKVKVTIFYYDDFDRAEKIKNLAIILEPDNLIKLTGGSNPVISFETYEK